MKIVICASMSAAKKILSIGEKLEANGHTVVLPEGTKLYAEGKLLPGVDEPNHKISNDLIRDHYNKIASSDSVLIVNEDKKGIKNYIGGNTFLEMGFAHVLDKKIFLLHGIPEISYKDEIIAMQPIVLEENLNNII